MDSHIQRGRWLLIAVIAVSLGGDAIAILLEVAATGLADARTTIVSCFLKAVVLVMIWHGAEWARWLTVSLHLLAIVIVGGVLVFQETQLALIVLLAQYIIVVVPLAFSSSISSFMEFQRQKEHADSYSPRARNPYA